MTDSSVTGRNQNHSDVRDESARDNDPLFELSRIFGFDEPAEQKNIYTPQAEPELSSEMSLERELMAGFDADFATDFAAEPEPLASNYQPEPLASSYRPEPAASNYQPEPVVSSYQPMQQDYRPAAPAASESRSAQRVVEPHFSGYAPLQRAYAPQAPADSFVDQQPAAEPEATQYYAEPDYAQATPAASQDSYYSAYSDLPQAPAFSEPVQDDYFTSLDNALNESFTDEPAPQPLADTSAFDLSEIGREPQHEFIAPSYSDAFAQSKAFSEAAQPAAASFEDELSFLLQDAAPVAAPVQPVAPRYEEPVYTQAPSAYQPAAYSEPVIPQTDFAPLFDAPAPDVAPVVTRFDEQETAVESNYATAPAADFDQIDDEFFAAPDLSHLPNRTSAPQSNWDAEQADDGAVNSFADLFGASSQPDTAVQTETDNSYQPEQAVSYEEQQSESFDFADDFYSVEETNTVAEQAYAPEPVALLSHNAVRGYSSYTFGAATPAAAGTESVVGQYHTPESTYDAAPVAAVPVVSAPAYEEPAAADNFFNNDDFDFSFDEDIQPENDFSVAEEELTFELPEEPEVPAYEPVQSSARKSYTPAPDIETVVVSENKVEQTQSLDLPEVSYGDDAKATGLNSLESEFAEIFSTISVNEAAAPDTTSEADKAFENILQDNFAEFHAAKKAEPQQPEADHGYGTLAGAAAGLAGAAVAGTAMRGSAPQARTDAAGNATQDDYYNHWAAQGAQNNDFDTYNLNENFARDEEEYAEVRPHEKAQQRKPLFWAGVAAAALIVVGGGYYMLKSGGVVGGEPEVLRADSQPVKMQPENPGGAIVPNQDKAVYDQVSGTKPAAPEQKTLINTEEEPVDVGLLAGQDVEEDRLMAEEATNNGNSAPAAAKPSAQEAERELVTPRTVRTMVVRADGTIVPSEAPAAPSKPAPTDTGLDEASRLISQSAVPERLGTDKPAASTQSAAAPRVVQTQTFTASGEQVKPTAAPVVPSRPAEQPVNVVGNVERPAQNQNQALQQVANANVPAANTAAPAGTWFIQVASQPSAELAQKNYANLTTRYGNIIGGKGVDIKKADIPGKGTYYRVRIPGGSKAEAAALCDRLKSAGGSCFPTL